MMLCLWTPCFIQHQNTQSFSPFHTHYSVSMFSASNWIPRFDFILCDIFSTECIIGCFVGVERPSGCPLLAPTYHGETSLSASPNRFWLLALLPRCFIFIVIAKSSSHHISHTNVVPDILTIDFFFCSLTIPHNKEYKKKLWISIQC